MPNIWCKDTNVTVTGEEFNTRKEQRNKAAFSASVVLRCPWDTRAALVEAMIKEDDGLGAAYPDFGSARVSSFEINPFPAQPKLTNEPYESEIIVYKEALSNRQLYKPYALLYRDAGTVGGEQARRLP